METYLLRNWIGIAGHALQTGWSKNALTELATLEVPSKVLGEMGWAIRADAAATWAQWFMDSLVDSARYIQQLDLGFAHLYHQLRIQLAQELPLAPTDEIQALATQIAETAWQEISYRRDVRRKAPDRRQRELLWLRNEPDPRCYLCGYKFCVDAKAHFLGRGPMSAIKKPLLFDFVRPRGLHVEDLTIQIDHVRPVRAGGKTEADNLQLACGWCNRAKSDHMQIFGVSSWTDLRIRHQLLGWVSIPRSLWVVRSVQLSGRCEDRSGCTALLRSNELFVAPKRRSGALNPSNFSVYCQHHDPWADTRYVGANILPRRSRRSP